MKFGENYIIFPVENSSIYFGSITVAGKQKIVPHTHTHTNLTVIKGLTLRIKTVFKEGARVQGRRTHPSTTRDITLYQTWLGYSV